MPAILERPALDAGLASAFFGAGVEAVVTVPVDEALSFVLDGAGVEDWRLWRVIAAPAAASRARQLRRLRLGVCAVRGGLAFSGILGCFAFGCGLAQCRAVGRSVGGLDVGDGDLDLLQLCGLASATVTAAGSQRKCAGCQLPGPWRLHGGRRALGRNAEGQHEAGSRGDDCGLAAN
ncbi:hypothetical protein [Arthrobacter sp.]|uniref:hypothetical protein n=1 Tax=Arthrobacter sp. TaxID=1667 RepID=UPI003A8D419F